MRTRIYQTVILILTFVLFSCTTLKKEDVLFKFERQQLLSKEVEMQLPIPFHIQKNNYDEGIVYFYSFADSAFIVLFQGAMMELPIDKYKPKKIELKNQRKISVGFENNRFWRKDVYKGVSIYYDNVPLKDKSLYDKVLDRIKIRSF